MIYVLHDISAVESSRLRRVRCSVVLLSFPSYHKWYNAGQTRFSSLPLTPPTIPLTTPSSTLLASATTSLGPVAATCPSVTRAIQQPTSFLRCPLVVVTDCARWFGPPAPPNATLSTYLASGRCHALQATSIAHPSSRSPARIYAISSRSFPHRLY